MDLQAPQQPSQARAQNLNSMVSDIMLGETLQLPGTSQIIESSEDEEDESEADDENVT